MAVINHSSGGAKRGRVEVAVNYVSTSGIECSLEIELLAQILAPAASSYRNKLFLKDFCSPIFISVKLNVDELLTDDQYREFTVFV